jgi:hypothetical protein
MNNRKSILEFVNKKSDLIIRTGVLLAILGIGFDYWILKFLLATSK